MGNLKPSDVEFDTPHCDVLLNRGVAFEYNQCATYQGNCEVAPTLPGDVKLIETFR